jgi:hypothetical protein
MILADQVVLEGEDLLGPPVDEGDAPVAVDGEDRIGRDLEDLFEGASAPVSRKLGLFALADVLEEDRVSTRFSIASR